MREAKDPILPTQSHEKRKSEDEENSDDQHSKIYPDIVSRDNSPLSTFSTDDIASRTATPNLRSEDDEFSGVALSMTSDAESLPIFTPQAQSPMHSQFIFPDPLPAMTAEHTGSKLPETGPATQVSSEWGIDDDVIGTELCDSPRRRRSRRVRREWEEPCLSSSDNPPSFLPFFDQHAGFLHTSPVNDHSQAAEGSPSANDCLLEVQNKLANLSEQRADEQNDLETLPDHLTSIQEILNTHSRESQQGSNHAADDHLARQSQPANHTQQLADLQDQLSKLSVNIADLHQTVATDIRSLNSATRTLQQNTNALLTAWENMRTELLDLKVAHQKLKKEQHRRESSRDSKKGRPRRRNSLTWAKDDPPSRPSSGGPPADDRANVPDQIVIPPRDEFSLQNLLARWLPDVAPTEAWKREPTVVTRVPVPEPVAGDAFRGEPPAYDTERADDRSAAHLKDYPMGCRWPGCPICGDEKSRRE